MLNVYVIGCGGIGGYLLDMMPKCITSLSLDCMAKRGLFGRVTALLESNGNDAVPSVVDRMVLIDGDTFNPRNAIRQGNGAGSKLVQRMRSLENDMLRVTYLRNMSIIGYNAFVNPDNIAMIIPPDPPSNEHNAEAEQLFSEDTLLHGNVIFLCVDNVKTRYEVSMYAETLPDVIVINGGNEKVIGHVTVYERSRGEALDPNLPEVYPDIRPDADKRPDEVGCDYVAPQHDQIAVTNSIVANVMMAMFNKWARSGVPVNKKGQRQNEVLIDTDSFVMQPLVHPKAN